MKFHNNIAIVEGDTHLSAWIVEHNTLEVARKYCQLFSKYIPAGGCVVDVGACLGDMTATFSKMVGSTGTIHAFEPNPIAFECLEHNMAEYSNVRLYPVALGDKCGHAHAVADANLGATQMRDDGEIPVWPLDSVVMGKVNFIKIDAEGWEGRILEGAVNTIERDRPVILLEINRPVLEAQGYSDKDIFGLLSILRYSVVPPEPHLKLDGPMVDILCLPNE